MVSEYSCGAFFEKDAGKNFWLICSRAICRHWEVGDACRIRLALFKQPVAESYELTKPRSRILVDGVGVYNLATDLRVLANRLLSTRTALYVVCYVDA